MMKKIFIIAMIGTLLVGCTNKKSESENPFYQTYENKYDAPPFEKIKVEHYMPAFEDGIMQHQAEIDSIANNSEPATFANTIETMEFSGELLQKVSLVFFNIQSANTNDEIDAVALRITPKLTEHNDNIYLNDQLFERVKLLHDAADSLNLTAEQNRLLDKYYKRFVRSGALLNDQQKAQLREINKELSTLELTFGQNVLAETNAYQKFVENEAELEGLPEGVKQAAADAAKEAGKQGQWLFTTQKSSFIPVLQYADNRELREELLMAYTSRCNHNNEYDNKENINKIMKLRVKKSHLLGFESPADFILDNTMAKTPETVYSLVNRVYQPGLGKAKAEAYELQKMMDAEGKGEKLAPWDWWYYTEKLRKEKFDLNEETLRPYFKLENVRQGIFDLTTKLYGLQYEKLNDMPVYQDDVEAFKVADADGSLVGYLYTDYFPRAGKNVGAWMSNYREQYIKDGINQRPIIVNVGNFTKPTGDKPSLLTMDEVETMFHEFGHALHGLLAQATYPTLSGTNVARDFVELPSQIMENWCWEPEVMKTYAKHYQTGEVMPQELMDKIRSAGTFNQGFTTTELLSAALMDMDYHVKKDTSDIDVMAFEKQVMDRIGMIPEIIVRYRSPYFKHIFEGGYSAGYYGYIWAEVLDADAYAKFKESGDIFNKEIATSFRKNILEKGDSDDPMVLYRAFRGAAPTPDALLKNRGLK